MQIGSLGVIFVLDALSASETAQFARHIENLGYRTLWLPEGDGRDPFSHAAYRNSGFSYCLKASVIQDLSTEFTRWDTDERRVFLERFEKDRKLSCLFARKADPGAFAPPACCRY